RRGGAQQVADKAVTPVVEGVHAPVFPAPLPPNPRARPPPPWAVLDEQTAERQLDPVSFVRRMALLPERFGDDAEHRAAIEREGAVADFVQGEISEVMGHGLLLRALSIAPPGDAPATMDLLALKIRRDRARGELLHGEPGAQGPLGLEPLEAGGEIQRAAGDEQAQRAFDQPRMVALHVERAVHRLRRGK